MWKNVKLGEVCDFKGGSQPPKKEFVYKPKEGYVRFLQIRDFKSDKNIFCNLVISLDLSRSFKIL